MKLGTHALKDKGHKINTIRFMIHKYAKGRSRKVEQSLDRLFGKS